MLMTSKLDKQELEILRGISIHKVLGLSNNGLKIKMKCPFHNERTPSFYLYPENGFYCFGCGKKGNGAIDFMVALGYTFQEAIQELGNYL